MFRKDLLDLLLDNPMSVAEISRETHVPVKEVRDDLDHLVQSLRHTGHELAVTPARCRKCGFDFDAEKLTKPSKCPECRATWIRGPLLEIRRQRPN